MRFHQNVCAFKKIIYLIENIQYLVYNTNVSTNKTRIEWHKEEFTYENLFN